MIAVIAGASGLVGSHVLELLLEDSSISKVIALVRRPLSVQHPKLESIAVQDFSKLHDYSSQLTGDLYFCCLGTTIKTAGTQDAFMKVDFDSVVDFGKIAKQNQAKKFLLVSASGAHASSAIFYNRVKGKAEEALRALNLKSLVFFRPGLLMGNRTESRPGEKFAIKTLEALSPYLPKSWISRVATSVATLAFLMVQESKKENSGVTVIEAAQISHAS
jgi:uncharacterized protein YbjT (DUF2867 family)